MLGGVMIGGMIDAVKGCLKEEMRMDVTSNNLANSTVIGFKKERISFQNLLDRQENAGVPIEGSGTGSNDSALIHIKTDLSQGDIRVTGNSLDFTIYGKGFFRVDTPDGIRYTRKGNFKLDAMGFLVTQGGYQVMGKGGPINISGGEIHVDGQGAIESDGSEVGQIDVVDFEDYKTLIKEGNALYKNDSGDPGVAPPLETKIEQGYVELSNVNVAEEMIQMIHSLRAFESYQKAIQVLDGLNNRAINEVSRLR